MREVDPDMSAAVCGRLTVKIHRLRAAVFRQSQFSFRILCAEIFVPKSIHFRGFGLLGGDCGAKLPQRARVQFLAVVTGVAARNIR